MVQPMPKDAHGIKDDYYKSVSNIYLHNRYGPVWYLNKIYFSFKEQRKMDWRHKHLFQKAIWRLLLSRKNYLYNWRCKRIARGWSSWSNCATSRINNTSSYSENSLFYCHYLLVCYNENRSKNKKPCEACTPIKSNQQYDRLVKLPNRCIFRYSLRF